MVNQRHILKILRHVVFVFSAVMYVCRKIMVTPSGVHTIYERLCIVIHYLKRIFFFATFEWICKDVDDICCGIRSENLQQICHKSNQWPNSTFNPFSASIFFSLLINAKPEL